MPHNSSCSRSFCLYYHCYNEAKKVNKHIIPRLSYYAGKGIESLFTLDITKSGPGSGNKTKRRYFGEWNQRWWKESAHIVIMAWTVFRYQFQWLSALNICVLPQHGHAGRFRLYLPWKPKSACLCCSDRNQTHIHFALWISSACYFNTTNAMLILKQENAICLHSRN